LIAETAIVLKMFIVDAHLDLAWQVERGRDPRMRSADQPPANGEVASMSLPELREGNVGLICATLFASPSRPHRPNGYTTAEQARAQVLKQLKWYQQMQAEGWLKFVRSRADLPRIEASDDACAFAKTPTKMLLLMEGADPIRTPDDVPEWFDAGLRVCGLAWSKTRLAGGTGAPGPITQEGRELIRAFDQIGIIHDASHLSDESFWNLLDLTNGPIIASHSNCRAITGEIEPRFAGRHLTDEMIRALVARGGVIGINFYDLFLMPPGTYRTRPCTLNDLIAHIRRICDLAGNANHVAIGTDMDGGVGRDDLPQELKTIADLPKLALALRDCGFGEEDVGQIMGGNWLRCFGHVLPP
jgi:membrane dipeptidase